MENSLTIKINNCEICPIYHTNNTIGTTLEIQLQKVADLQQLWFYKKFQSLDYLDDGSVLPRSNVRCLLSIFVWPCRTKSFILSIWKGESNYKQNNYTYIYNNLRGKHSVNFKMYFITFLKVIPLNITY